MFPLILLEDFNISNLNHLCVTSGTDALSLILQYLTVKTWVFFSLYGFCYFLTFNTWISMIPIQIFTYLSKLIKIWLSISCDLLSFFLAGHPLSYLATSSFLNTATHRIFLKIMCILFCILGEKITKSLPKKLNERKHILKSRTILKLGIP